MKKILLLAVAATMSSALAVDINEIISDLTAIATSARAESGDIKKRTCPEAAGDAAKLMQGTRKLAHDVDENVAQEVDSAVNAVLAQQSGISGRTITFNQVIAGLFSLEKGLTKNPTRSQLNVLMISSKVAGALANKVNALADKNWVKNNKIIKAGVGRMVIFVNALQKLLTNCEDVGNQTKLDLEMAELQKQVEAENAAQGGQDPFDF